MKYLKLLVLVMIIGCVKVEHNPVEPVDVGAGVEDGYTGTLQTVSVGSIPLAVIINGDYKNKNTAETNYIAIQIYSLGYSSNFYVTTVTATNYSYLYTIIYLDSDVSNYFNVRLYHDANTNTNYDAENIYYQNNNIKKDDGLLIKQQFNIL